MTDMYAKYGDIDRAGFMLGEWIQGGGVPF